jgi:hypothetical protein
MEHVTAWKAAMLMLLPFLRGRQKLRVWLALIGASVASHFINDLFAFILIDGLAAYAILRKPAGLAQKLIGALFLCMMMLDLGFLRSPQYDWGLFYQISSTLGWAQLLILGAWTGHDYLGRYRHWADATVHPPPAHERHSR